MYNTAFIPITDICDDIARVLSEASGIKTTKSYSEVTEGIPSMECPRLQVYPTAVINDSRTATDRSTFGAGMQQEQLTIVVDVFARQRSHIYLDMEATVKTLDALIAVLQAQERPPFFDNKAIKSMKWNWKMASLRYGDKRYLGGQFTIFVRIF